MKRPKNNVIPITVKDGGVFHVPEKIMIFIKREIYDHDVKAVAEACGVSPSCIYAFRAGRTKWPRGATLFAILAYLDLQVRLERRGSNNPNRV